MKPLLSMAMLVALSACTSEQAYYAGQQMQANQCSQLPDRHDYDACMSRNKTSYETYKKESGQK